ncbi:3-oxoacyl-ACP synthase III family protein [Ulvibacterium sp.]|uniref:3-oxoacyl-ACP synthase III family protein n=1 Tax=Ulvibacterium sp. TaxID=2665914 RepID=UPI002611C308|nr:3-oxoacyl-[acyl-carrier-protein] synthase III C-terminal domain-containing protein [Ulvibacterium sp.]
MKLKFNNKKITGILNILPSREVQFEDNIDNYNFSRAQSMKLKLIMGYDKRRIVKEETVSDLCICGFNYLFQKGVLKKDDLDALILVTQSPDYFMPPTSHVIHGALGLKQDMVCMDINQGCSGYVIGLNQAFQLLNQEEINKVALLNADTLSKKVSPKDRNNNPQIGDGASITIIEKDQKESTIYGTVKVEGKGADVLIIPAGGYKTPSTAETSLMKEDDAGNVRSLDHLMMKGDEVFNFVQREIPTMVEELLAEANTEKSEVDYFMFHQPNKFMLKKLADKMKVAYQKMPNNIVERFGNSSGVSIPTTIAFNIGEKLEKESFSICLAGFGVGLSWASILLRLGPLDFCEIIDYK